MVDFLRLKYEEIARSVGNNNLVLDVGCGSAKPTKIIAQTNKVVALDVSIEVLINAKNNEIPFVCGVAENLPFKEEVFDVVCAIELIEHLKRPEAFLSEVRRVLKENGKLVLTCPNIASFRSRLYFLIFGAFPDYSNPKHVQHFTSYTLGKLLEENGFEIMNIFSIGFSAPYAILPRKLGEFFIKKVCKMLRNLGFGDLGGGIFVIARKKDLHKL